MQLLSPESALHSALREGLLIDQNEDFLDGHRLSDFDADELDHSYIAQYASFSLGIKLTTESIAHLLQGDPTIAEIKEGILEIYYKE